MTPHAGQPVAHAGAKLAEARAAMIMLHGRGGSAEEMLTLHRKFGLPDFAYLAPQAAGGSWYPYSFMAPVAQNEPGLSSGISVISQLIAALAEDGIATEKIVLLGFSQGACLGLEYAVRHARRYGGLVGLSGGLIGPAVAARDEGRPLEGTPVFLGCSDVDFHVPATRVRESGAVFQKLGGQVTMRLYPGMGHTINREEIGIVRELMCGVP